MQTKHTTSLDLKAIQPDGTFTGLLSPYNSIDSYNDTIDPGAYRKTRQDGGNTRPLLWQHMTENPIGMLELIDRQDGLWVKGQILLDIPQGKTSYALVKAGIVKGLSIGFVSIRDNTVKGVRHLQEIKLFEGSIVTFGAAPEAVITSVKSSKEADEYAAAYFRAFATALVEFKHDVLKSLNTSTKAGTK